MFMECYVHFNFLEREQKTFLLTVTIPVYIKIFTRFISMNIKLYAHQEILPET